MKICWDNLENLEFTKNGNFRDIKRNTYYYIYCDNCKECGEPFLKDRKSKGLFCSIECSKLYKKGKKHPMYGKKHSEETKKIMSEMKKGENNPFYGKHHTDEAKNKISKVRKGKPPTKGMYGKKHSTETKKKMSLIKRNKYIGKDNHNWKGGYSKKGIPLYDTYAPQLEWREEVRRNEQDPNVLEVKCFKCGKWFVPTTINTCGRIYSINENEKYKGYYRFYCSGVCKHSCSIFGKTSEQIMREDAVRAGRLPWTELTREVQPELRQMVLERDEYKCVKCGETENIQCHHIYPVSIEPLLSADMDNCMTLCVKCHKEAHQKDGCRYNQLRMEICQKTI